MIVGELAAGSSFEDIMTGYHLTMQEIRTALGHATQLLTSTAAPARQNAEWQANLDDTLARAARGENVHYDSTDAFIAALDEIPTEGSSESGS